MANPTSSDDVLAELRDRLQQALAEQAMAQEQAILASRRANRLKDALATLEDEFRSSAGVGLTPVQGSAPLIDPVMPRQRPRIIRRDSRTLVMEFIRGSSRAWSLKDIGEEYGKRGHLEGISHPTEMIRAVVNRLINQSALVRLPDGRFIEGPSASETGVTTRPI